MFDAISLDSVTDDLRILFFLDFLNFYETMENIVRKVENNRSEVSNDVGTALSNLEDLWG